MEANQTASSKKYSLFWKRNLFWMASFLLALLILVIWENWLIWSGVRLMAWLAVIFLAFTVIPMNALKINPQIHGKGLWIWLAGKRRDWGILAGLFAVLHAVLAWYKYANLDFGFAFLQPIFPGLLGLLILVLMLITSSLWSMRILQKNWKRLHLMIYFFLPAMLLHGVQAEDFFDNSFSWIAAIGLGLTMTFALLMDLRLFNSPTKPKLTAFVHTWLVLAGMVLAGLLVLFYSGV